MKHRQQWQPNRVLWNDSRQRFEPNKAKVYGGSYFIAERQLEAYIPLIQAHISGDVLDCGCGEMPYLAVFEAQANSVTGVDWPSTHGTNRFADVEADINAGLPFDDGAFDSILCTDVIAHIFKPHDLFEAFARVLKPGGHAVVTTPFFYWISEPPHEYFRYTEYALRRLSEEAGLEVAHLAAYGGQRDVELDALNKRHATRWSYRWFRLRRAVIEASRSAGRSDIFPLGYCLVARKPDLG